MEPILIFKALSNESRRQILELLKRPRENFGLQGCLSSDTDFNGGICVGRIREKTGLTQSVVSSYLLLMQKAGLLESKRYGQWTYYRRDEKTIQTFSDYIKNEL
jgi:ArsR family transcriptional regulator